MPDAEAERRSRKLIRLLTEQPLLVQIVGSIAVVLILTLIGKLAHLIGQIGYVPILLAIGITALVGGVSSLIRHRHSLNMWQFISVVALVVMGSSLTGVVAGHQLGHGSANPPPQPRKDTASCQAPSRVGLTLSQYELRVCDCIDGQGIRTPDSPVPYDVTTVSCDRSHDAEVYFTGSIWPPGTAYPGANKVNAQADARCQREFAPYVGQTFYRSAFTYDYWDPDGTAWAQHDRFVVCAAYNPLKPLDRSIRGSHSLVLDLRATAQPIE